MNRFNSSEATTARFDSAARSHVSHCRFPSIAAPQLAIAILAISILWAHAVALPSDWQHEQTFNVSTPGLLKLSLPVETLDAARTALEDLRRAVKCRM
jgi:hypothetical protein